MLGVEHSGLSWTVAGGYIFGGVTIGLCTAAVRHIGGKSRGRTDLLKDTASGLKRISHWLFGHEADPTTGLPGTPGWCAEVDQRLADLNQNVGIILREVLPDGNGGHNMRGDIARAASAAAAEVKAAVAERERVHAAGG